MGVPPKLNPAWKKAVDAYIEEFDCDVKVIGGDDERIALIAFDEKTLKCSVKLRKYEPVYKFPIKKLFFNAYSSRLGQYAEVAKTLDQNKQHDKNLIKNRLLEKQKGNFTKKLKDETQTEPAIALADGVIIDGNRRMANLIQGGVEYLFVVFLPKDIDQEEAEKIEAFYSNQSDGSEEYGKLEQGRQYKEYKANHGTVEGLVQILQGVTKEKIEEHIKAYELASQYAKMKKWKIGGTQKIDVDRINDESKGGPGFDIFQTRLNKNLPASKDRDKLALAAFCIIRGMKERKNPETGKTGLGRLDPPIDQFIRMTNNAKGKATFLKECPLLQGKNKSKWQDLLAAEEKVTLFHILHLH